MKNQQRAIPFIVTLAGLLALLSLLLTLPALADPAQNDGTWQQVNTPSSPGNRTGHSLVVIDNVVYLFGGHTPAGFQNDLWKFDPLTNHWTQVSASGAREGDPPGCANHAATVVDGKMVIYGGTDGTNVLNDLWAYDPVANTWTQRTPPGPTPPGLEHHSAVVSNGQMYLVGGTTSSGPSDELWAYDLTADSWTEKADYPGPFGGAYGAAVFAPDSTIVVGGTMDDDKYYVYDPGTDSWAEKTATSSPPSRTSPGTAQVGNTAYIFGGEDRATTRNRTDVWEADLSQDPAQWEPEPPDMPNHQAEIVLVPEMYSPCIQGWLYAFPNADAEPGVLLYGRSWTYDPHNPIPVPIWGDAATFIFWPNGSPAGPLAGITVWPEDAVVGTGQQHVFNATGRDAHGYYVPITPTWGATGGAITDFGQYTAGDWPGTYYVAAVASAGREKFRIQVAVTSTATEEFRIQVPVTVTGTETCPDLSPGESYTHTFTYTGSFPYHDRANPDHKGTVVVYDTAVGYATIPVSITATGFDPDHTVIARNGTVGWTNTDTTATHAVVGGDPGLPHHYVYLPLVLRQWAGWGGSSTVRLPGP